eukprot:54650-Rhodomonas_salina.3
MAGAALATCRRGGGDCRGASAAWTLAALCKATARAGSVPCRSGQRMNLGQCRRVSVVGARVCWCRASCQ